MWIHPLGWNLQVKRKLKEANPQCGTPSSIHLTREEAKTATPGILEGHNLAWAGSSSVWCVVTSPQDSPWCPSGRWGPDRWPWWSRCCRSVCPGGCASLKGRADWKSDNDKHNNNNKNPRTKQEKEMTGCFFFIPEELECFVKHG